MEHVLLLAFERLGNAQAELSLMQQDKTRLDLELKAMSHHNAALQNSLSEFRLAGRRTLAAASRPAQPPTPTAAVKLKPSVAKQQQAASVPRGYSEQLRQRFMRLQEAKELEVQSLHQRLAESREKTAHEARLREQAEMRANELRLKLIELIDALNLERQQVSAIQKGRQKGRHVTSHECVIKSLRCVPVS